MKKENNAPALAGATSETELKNKIPSEAQLQAEAEAKAKAEAENEVTASTEKASDNNIVLFEEGEDKYELTVREFTFKGKKYVSADAVKNNPEVLQALVKVKSFILKKYNPWQ